MQELQFSARVQHLIQDSADFVRWEEKIGKGTGCISALRRVGLLSPKTMRPLTLTFYKEGCCLRTAGDAEFLKHVCQVVFDRLVAELQSRGDLFVGHSFGH